MKMCVKGPSTAIDVLSVVLMNFQSDSFNHFLSPICNLNSRLLEKSRILFPCQVRKIYNFQTRQVKSDFFYFSKFLARE